MPAAASSSGRTATSGRCETAKMLAEYDVVWFEEALPPDDIDGFIELRRHAPLPIATGEVLDAPAELSAVHRTPGGGHHPAGLHQVRRR